MIKYFEPTIGQPEIDAVIEVIKSGWLTSGKETEAFEKEFAEYDGMKYAVAVNSATSGLHLAYLTQISKTVYVPVYTFLSTYRSAEIAGKFVMVCDIENDEYNFDFNKLVNSGGIVVPVHIGGKLCNIENIKSGVIIEDCAHRFPGCGYAKGNNYKTGLIHVFSFYANKLITTGEGGMITTNDEKIYKKLKLLRYLGMNNSADKRLHGEYDIIDKGFKYNMPDILAAIGRQQLKRIGDQYLRRQEIAKEYIEGFKHTGIWTRKEDANNHWHLFFIRHKRIDKIRIKLEEKGIQYSHHFKPLNRFSIINKLNLFQEANERYEQTISLPIYSGLKKVEITKIIETCKKALSKE